MADKPTTSSSGVGIGTLLFLLFLGLKLGHVIFWSWWWVTAPLWIPAAFVLVVLGFVLFFAVIAALAR